MSPLARLLPLAAVALAACATDSPLPQRDLAASRVTTIGVNAYLWRAALDTLAFADRSDAVLGHASSPTREDGHDLDQWQAQRPGFQRPAMMSPISRIRPR